MNYSSYAKCGAFTDFVGGIFTSKNQERKSTGMMFTCWG
jgi:hypothetical protein